MRAFSIMSAFGAGVEALWKNDASINAFMGISAGYPHFQQEPDIEGYLESYIDRYLDKKKLDAYVRFGQDFTSSLTLVTYEPLLAYNLMAFDGLPDDEAIELGAVAGDLTAQALAERIAAFPWVELQRVQSTWEVQYKPVIDLVREFADRDDGFRNRCAAITAAGATNRLRRIRAELSEAEYAKRLEIATKYAIDDVAISLQMYRTHPVSVSKYDLPSVIKLFATGSYQRLREGFWFPSIGHIQVVPTGEQVHHTLYDDEYELKRIAEA